MFEIKSNPQLNKESFVFNNKGEYPYFTRTIFNNGILGYVDYLDTEHKIKGNCLAVGMMAMKFFYIKNDFYAGQFTKRAIPLGFELNEKIASFFITLLNKKQDIFKNVLVRDFEKTFKKEKILLPIKNNEIDFDFIENFIDELEKSKINQVKEYLQKNNLDNYNLTEKEQKVLEKFENEESDWEDFNIIDLFEVKNCGNILSRDIIENSGNTPYLCASRENNSVSSYINYDSKFIDKGHCIFIGGKTFVVTYQEKDFFSNDSHNLGLYFKDKQINKFHYFFLISCIEKALHHKYSWGNSISKTKIKTDKIKLPIKNNEIDFESMEILVSAIEKLVIKDVVLYVEKKLNI